MIWFSLSALLLSVAWFHLTPLYREPSPWWLVYLTLAVVCARRGPAVSPVPDTLRWSRLVFAIGLIVVIVLLPWPYRLGPSVLLLSAALGVLRARLGRIALWERAVGFVGLILTAQSAVLPVWYHFFSRYHDAPQLAGVSSGLLNALGLTTTFDGARLFIQTFEQLVAVRVTWDALGLFAFGLWLVGTILVTWLIAGWRRLPWLLAASAVFLIVRFVAVVLLYLETGRTDLLWNPFFTLVSFLPLILMQAAMMPIGPATEWRLPLLALPPRSAWRPAVWVSAGVVLVVFAIVWQDPGVRKPGRVLIDEGHSEWEWTTRKYDTEWYSQASGYNYYCLADYLTYFYRVETTLGDLTYDRLKDFDVLILKTLTKQLKPEEIDAIVGWVADGGGLFVIGDHTNVFGMSTHMNPLMRRFGMAYQFDATYQLNTGALQVFHRPTVALQPIARVLPRTFLYGTSCSLTASPFVRSVLVGPDLRALVADYSRESFFPENRPTLDMQIGAFLQQAAVRYGKGRVTAFTDSTIFSNFWFFMPGKSELFLASVDWVNRRNRWTWVNWLVMATGVFALGRGLRRTRGTEIVSTLAPLLFCLMATGIAVRGADSLNARAHQPAPLTRPLPQIAFNADHCDFTLPAERLDVGMPLDNHYHTFFVWTQRLGYIPRFISTLDSCFRQSRVTVFINPRRPFSAEELQRCERYVSEGGRILVMDDGRNGPQSTANQLLGRFDMQYDFKERPAGAVANAAATPVAVVQRPCGITGGIEMLRFLQGGSFLAGNARGKGLVLAIGASYQFTDQAMGVTSVIPTVEQRRVYELEYWLFRNLIGDNIDLTTWSDLQPPAVPSPTPPTPMAR